MTTQTLDHRFGPASDARPSRPFARYLSILGAETKLILRNRTILATALLLGPLMAVSIALIQLGQEGEPGSGMSLFVTNMAVVWCSLMAVYYNLTSIFVSRREDRVFKRLLTGESTQTEVVAAAATPSVVIFLVQVVLTALAGFLLFGVPNVTNPVTAVVALLLVAMIFVVLAAASTSFTSSVESAQYTTMPLIMLFVLFGGTMPITVFPEPLRAIVEWLPLNASAEIMTIGLNGTNLDGAPVSFAESWGASAMPFVVLLAWLAVGGYLAATRMRFEPRR